MAKRFKIPEGVKEIIITDKGEVRAIKYELIKIRPEDWEIQPLGIKLEEENV